MPSINIEHQKNFRQSDISNENFSYEGVINFEYSTVTKITNASLNNCSSQGPENSSQISKLLFQSKNNKSYSIYNSSSVKKNSLLDSNSSNKPILPNKNSIPTSPLKYDLNKHNGSMLSNFLDQKKVNNLKSTIKILKDLQKLKSTEKLLSHKEKDHCLSEESISELDTKKQFFINSTVDTYNINSTITNKKSNDCITLETKKINIFDREDFTNTNISSPSSLSSINSDFDFLSNSDVLQKDNSFIDTLKIATKASTNINLLENKVMQQKYNLYIQNEDNFHSTKHQAQEQKIVKIITPYKISFSNSSNIDSSSESAHYSCDSFENITSDEDYSETLSVSSHISLYEDYDDSKTIKYLNIDSCDDHDKLMENPFNTLDQKYHQYPTSSSMRSRDITQDFSDLQSDSIKNHNNFNKNNKVKICSRAALQKAGFRQGCIYNAKSKNIKIDSKYSIRNYLPVDNKNSDKNLLSENKFISTIKYNKNEIESIENFKAINNFKRNSSMLKENMNKKQFRIVVRSRPCLENIKSHHDHKIKNIDDPSNFVESLNRCDTSVIDLCNDHEVLNYPTNITQLTNQKLENPHNDSEWSSQRMQYITNKNSYKIYKPTHKSLNLKTQNLSKSPTASIETKSTNNKGSVDKNTKSQNYKNNTKSPIGEVKSNYFNNFKLFLHRDNISSRSSSFTLESISDSVSTDLLYNSSLSSDYEEIQKSSTNHSPLKSYYKNKSSDYLLNSQNSEISKPNKSHRIYSNKNPSQQHMLRAMALASSPGSVMNCQRLTETHVDSVAQGYDEVIGILRTADCHYTASLITLTKAKYLLRHDQWQRAMQIYLAPEPEEADTDGRGAPQLKQVNLSAVYILKGEYSKAIQCADSVIKVNNQNAQALLNKGAALLALGENEAAIKLLQQTLSLKNQCTHEALHNIVIGAMRQEDGEQAETALTKLLRAYPVKSVQWLDAVWTMAELNETLLKNTSEAIRWYRLLLSLRPTDAQLLNKLGDLYSTDVSISANTASDLLTELVQRVQNSTMSEQQKVAIGVEVLGGIAGGTIATRGKTSDGNKSNVLSNSEGFQEVLTSNNGLHYYLRSFMACPTKASQAVRLGVAYIRQGLFANAIDLFIHVQKLNPDDLKWKLLITSCVRRLGWTRIALDCYRYLQLEHTKAWGGVKTADEEGITECKKYIAALEAEENIVDKPTDSLKIDSSLLSLKRSPPQLQHSPRDDTDLLMKQNSTRSSEDNSESSRSNSRRKYNKIRGRKTKRYTRSERSNSRSNHSSDSDLSESDASKSRKLVKSTYKSNSRRQPQKNDNSKVRINKANSRTNSSHFHSDDSDSDNSYRKRRDSYRANSKDKKRPLNKKPVREITKKYSECDSSSNPESESSTPKANHRRTNDYDDLDESDASDIDIAALLPM